MTRGLQDKKSFENSGLDVLLLADSIDIFIALQDYSSEDLTPYKYNNRFTKELETQKEKNM